VTLDAAVATCFSPEEDCVAFTVHAIDAAERRILATSYALTTGSGIVEALVRAKRRGVDVRLIADKTTRCERGSEIDPLARADMPVCIDRGVSKTTVIDDQVALMGSMNWTQAVLVTRRISTSIFRLKERRIPFDWNERTYTVLIQTDRTKRPTVNSGVTPWC